MLTSLRNDSNMKASQFNPGNYFIHKEICLLIKEMIQAEKNIEIARQDLSLCPDFDSVTLFNQIDYQQTGLVTQIQLEEWLIEEPFGFNVDQSQIHLFMRRYDKDRDGRLRYCDFLDMLLPKQKEYSNISQVRKPFRDNDPQNLTFTPSTMVQLKKVLSLLLQTETMLEAMRVTIYGSFQMALNEQFDNFARGKEQATKTNIRRSINDAGYKLTEKDINYLMLRIDSDKLTFDQFVEILKPLTLVQK